MTHSQIVAYLETQATAAGVASFWTGKKAQADINYNAPFPQAHHFLMPSKIKGGHIIYQVMMGFYGKDEHENGTADTVAIQDEMDLLTQRFFALLAEEVNPELMQEESSRTPAVRVGAIVGTGFIINFELATLALC